jgi:hypothetical protein
MSQCPCPPRRLMNSRQLVANWYSFFSKGHQWSKGHQGNKSETGICPLPVHYDSHILEDIVALLELLLNWDEHCIMDESLEALDMDNASGLFITHPDYGWIISLSQGLASCPVLLNREWILLNLKPRRWVLKDGMVAFFSFFWFENHINHY